MLLIYELSAFIIQHNCLHLFIIRINQKYCDLIPDTQITKDGVFDFKTRHWFAEVEDSVIDPVNVDNGKQPGIRAG